METWQEVLRKNSISSLEALAAKFGPENFPDLDRLRHGGGRTSSSGSRPRWWTSSRRRTIRSGASTCRASRSSRWWTASSTRSTRTRTARCRTSRTATPTGRSSSCRRSAPRYCRFCTRRRKVGDPEKIPMSQFESAFQYLEEHTEIRDVIMSGGDPLLLNDRRLELILTRLRAIPHIEIIRIGSRVPCHLPERITPELCDTLKQVPPALHQHPLQPPRRAHARRREGSRHAGRRRHPARLPDRAPQGRQRRPGGHEGADAPAAHGAGAAVLHLHGRPGRRRRALPHDRRDRARDHERRCAAGPAGSPIPHFVIDAPGGGGKIPLLPEYVE